MHAATILARLDGALKTRTFLPLFYIVPVLVALALASIAPLTASTFTNQYVIDTHYLLNAGYLVYNGYVPHVGFEWQFGGYEIYLIALSLQMFGVSAGAIEQAIFFGFAIATILLCLGTMGQARVSTFCLLLLLVTATSITYAPFENGHVHLAAHSFAMFYNRICWALVIVLYSTLLLKEEPLRQWQLFACAAAGLLVLVTKLTFALMLLPAIFPLFVRNGAAGVGMCGLYALLLMVLGWLTLGFGPEAYINSVGDLANTAGGAFKWEWAVQKLIFVILYNIFLIIAALAAERYVWNRSAEKSKWLRCKLAVLRSLVYLTVLVTVTTGTLDYFLSATAPIFVFVAILCVDEARSGSRPSGAVLGAAVAWFTAVFSMPYLMNYVTAVAAEAQSPKSVFSDGPLKGLFANRLEGTSSPTYKSHAAALAYISARNRAEGGTQWFSDYDWQYVQVDAIRLARTLPDVRARHVLSFYPSTFPFALNARPIRTFPLLANEESPSMQALNAIPAEVDTVLVLRDDRANPLHQRFGASLRETFRLHARSALWDLYVRRSGPSLP
jgi:hypothetical protein